MTFGTATTTASPVPVIAVGQAVVLLGLAGTVGLSGAGWSAAAAYGTVLAVLLTTALRRSSRTVLGPANRVTLARALLVGGVTALVATSLTDPVAPLVLAGLAAVALALDGVDGQVARRTGSVSSLGARFDMEVDAFLIAVLGVGVAGQVGWWAAALGAYRYLFVAASWVVPWLAAPLPPRFSRKVVAATQGAALVVAAGQVLPQAGTTLLVAAALVALTWSFGRDVGWLRRTEQVRRAGLRTPLGSRPMAAVS